MSWFHFFVAVDITHLCEETVRKKKERESIENKKERKTDSVWKEKGRVTKEFCTCMTDIGGNSCTQK